MNFCLLAGSIAEWWASIEANMIDACINSAVGIIVVFTALLFFTFVISLFKYVGVLEQKLKENKEKN